MSGPDIQEIHPAALLLLGLAALYLIVSLAYFCYSWYRCRKMQQQREIIEKEYARIEESLATLDKANKVGATLLDASDFTKEWDYAERRCNEWLHQNAENAPDTNCTLKVKTVVCFFHKPCDARYEALLNGVIRFLRQGYHFLWVYSSDESPNWGQRFLEELQTALAEGDFADLKSKCAFLEMSEEDKRIPVNFCVFAPLICRYTVTYLMFPGDDDRHFTVRIEKPSVLAGKIDSLAAYFLARLAGEMQRTESSLDNGWSKRLHLLRDIQRESPGA